LNVLEVKKLRKSYESFTLKDVSFSVEEGSIMGFIGRNGAGKTTTMKSMLNLIGRDSGEVLFCGKDYYANETECKQDVGFIMGEFNCYTRSRLSRITEVTKRFYKNWDEEAYRGYLKRFGLDENKRVRELSAGMRVKYALALALSHNAKLLVLDEPTSGLDPVSRDDLLDVLRSVILDGTRSVLFSTHIISDLEKCADYITYITKGEIYASTDIESFKAGYLLVSGDNERLTEAKPVLIGHKEHAFGFTGLIKAEDAEKLSGCRFAPADLESIMIYVEQNEE
jgi:ABC-2 type transport system ATP-binding protein